MKNTTHYSYDQFEKKVFHNAYAIVNRHGLFHIYDDYEKEDGTLVSVFVENDDFNNGEIIELTNTLIEGGVDYNHITNEFIFTNDENCKIGKFKVLIVGTID